MTNDLPFPVVDLIGPTLDYQRTRVIELIEEVDEMTRSRQHLAYAEHMRTLAEIGEIIAKGRQRLAGDHQAAGLYFIDHTELALTIEETRARRAWRRWKTFEALLAPFKYAAGVTLDRTLMGPGIEHGLRIDLWSLAVGAELDHREALEQGITAMERTRNVDVTMLYQHHLTLATKHARDVLTWIEADEMMLDGAQMPEARS